MTDTVTGAEYLQRRGVRNIRCHNITRESIDIKALSLSERGVNGDRRVARGAIWTIAKSTFEKTHFSSSHDAVC